MKSCHRAIKHFAILCAVTAALVRTAPAVRAADWGLSADLPVTFAIGLDDGQGNSDAKSGSGVSGYAIALSSPWWLGVDYESYGGSFPANAIIGSFSYDVTMLDVLVKFPLPYARLAVGAGQGTGKLSKVQGASFRDADLSQLFFSAGWEVFGRIDLHAGFHTFQGKHKALTAGFPDLKVDGTMWSLGVGIAF